MTKQELIAKLRDLIEPSWSDAEPAHAEADKLLIEFINDAEIAEVYEQITKHYA